MSEREPLRITRRTALKWGALAAATPALSGLPLNVFASGDSVVLLWNEAALRGVRNSKLGPPMVARALAIVHTCIFDAWAAYDHQAVGTRLGGALRRPRRERTLANMNTAISFAAAQGQHVTPFALMNAAQLRSPTGPARYDSPAYESQARALLAISAGLTDEQKMIAEYWADGPHSELPPGHWDLFAQYVSRRDHHGANKTGVEADVKLFFALTNAVFDASICCWDNKRFFDSVRPITAIRYLFRGRRVRAWGGPYRGTQLINGEDWFPYQARTFPTPPFPEYSSGHSTFSAAGAEILRLFAGSESFGASVTFPAGSSKFEAGAVPAHAVTLSWATFKEAADQAGMSRRYGGIHFAHADLDARRAGRLVAQQAWAKAQTYFNRDASEEE